MRKSFVLDIEQGVKSARERMVDGSIEGIELFEPFIRLDKLKRSLDAIGCCGDKELYRYFPVAAIAALEGYFKAVVAKIVNADVIYTERGIEYAKEKLKTASDVAPLLHRDVISIGDVVAYVIAFNSVSSIERALTHLLGADFKNLVARAVDPYQLRNKEENAPVLVQSVNDLWADLSRAFERRHILAHEPAAGFSLSFEDAKAAVDACDLLMSAINAVLWNSIWKSTPLTQYEMNCAALEGYKAERDSLASMLRKALKVAKNKNVRGKFCKLHMRWKDFNKEWQSWDLDFFWKGSIFTTQAASSKEMALSARRNAIEEWICQMDTEDPSEY